MCLFVVRCGHECSGAGTPAAAASDVAVLPPLDLSLAGCRGAALRDPPPGRVAAPELMRT